MKILIIGAAGFIGSNLARKLSQEGHQIKSFDRRADGDICNYGQIEMATRGVDSIVNCAAILPHRKLLDKSYWDTNVKGVKNLVKACRRNGIGRLVHISTTGVFGPTGKAGVDENAKVFFEDIYTKTKHEGDKIIVKNMQKVPSVIIRPAIAYGPGDKRPVFLRLFRMIKTGFNISIGGGKNYLHTVYIDNLIGAIYLALTKKSAIGQDFIIGDKICYKMRDITDVISKVSGKKCTNIDIPKELALLGAKLLGMERTVRFVSEDRKYKIGKAMKVLGYRPKVGLLTGMTRTHKWFKENNLV